MPSSITHQLIAEEAKKGFPEEAQEAIAFAPDEYFLGSQGPDVFFFYRIGCRSESNLGKFMHRNRVYDLFRLFLNALRGENGAPRWSEADRKRVLSYCLGYVTHYCADSTFHPFVYRYLAEYGCEKRVHQQMENDWDVYFLLKYRDRSAEKYDFPFSAKTIIRNGVAERLYAYLAPRLGREDVGSGAFARGVKNFDLYLRFFHKKCYSAQRGWERTERFFHAKGLLSRLYPREIPEPDFLEGDHFGTLSEGRGKDADELFVRAAAESVRLAGLFLEGVRTGELPKEEFSKGLLTGKPL